MSGRAPWRRLFAAAVVAPYATSPSAAVPATDSQLWSELDVAHAMTTDLSTTGILTTRLGNGLPDPTLSAAGVQFDYRFGGWTASATGYYVSIRNAQNGARTGIWLPAAALKYGVAFGPVALSDRNRVEQLEGLPGSPTRYRNRASVDWRLPDEHAWSRALTDVFVADEEFYDFSKDRWTRNRVQAGLQLHLTEGTRMQTFYMRQDNSYGAPARLDVLGLTLQLDIR